MYATFDECTEKKKKFLNQNKKRKTAKGNGKSKRKASYTSVELTQLNVNKIF